MIYVIFLKGIFQCHVESNNISALLKSYSENHSITLKDLDVYAFDSIIFNNFISLANGSYEYEKEKVNHIEYIENEKLEVHSGIPYIVQFKEKKILSTISGVKI